MISFKGFPTTILILCIFSLMMSGCIRVQPARSVSLQIAYQTQMPVEGGSTISTGRLGTVHLSAPVLSARYEGDETVEFHEVSLPGRDDSFLQLSPQMFLQSEMSSSDSRGMSIQDYLKAISSEQLDSGKTVYLVVEADGRRVALPLKIQHQSDPTGFHVQFLTPQKSSPSVRYQPVIRESLSASDDSAERVALWNASSEQFLYAGETLVTIERMSSMGPISRCLGPASVIDQSELKPCKEVVVTWDDGDGGKVAELAYLWPTVPGLLIDCENPQVVTDLQDCLRSLQNFRHNFRWYRVSLSETGISMSGGTP
jgi:hypothetical protein